MIFLWHFLLTGPSIIWHGLANIYGRYVSVPTVIPKLQGKDVIVLVHGRNGHYSNFNTLMFNLKKQLSHDIVAVDLGYNRYTTIDTDVSRLCSAIEPLENCKITLVGMSKGGLVVMRYATTMNDSRVQNVITISAPLRGTLVTKFLPSNSSEHKELGYNSKISTEITGAIDDSYAVYHIVPRWDYIIIPTSSTYYETTDKDHIYFYKGYYSHLGIPFSTEVANAIIAWLTQ